MDRKEILARLRPSILSQLTTLEGAIGIPVRFVVLPSAATHVTAAYGFISGSPTVQLGPSWQDVDVAHELTHAAMELSEGYSVLQWRAASYATPARNELVSFIIRSYADDEVVHPRLVASGLALDGEVIRPQYFQYCDQVVANLSADSTQDGMATFDANGHGLMFRAVRIVQAQLLLKNFKTILSAARVKSTSDFLNAMAVHRKAATSKAQQILAYYGEHDAQTAAGHAAILRELIESEGIGQYVGLSTYARRNGVLVLSAPA